MTLKEAIEAVDKECAAEHRIITSDPVLEAQAKNILKSDIEQMEAAHLEEMITQGSPIYPVQSRLLVYSYIKVAFRLGMRVQRKLNNPDQNTAFSWRTQ